MWKKLQLQRAMGKKEKSKIIYQKLGGEGLGDGENLVNSYRVRVSRNKFW
jgi:hypothetical protein